MEWIVDWLKYLFGKVPQYIMEALTWFIEKAKVLFFTIIYWAWDKFCDLIEWLLSAIDYKNEVFEASLAWTMLPEQTIWIMNQISIDDGILMLTTAILIRLILNLIPSWATRV